MARNKHVFFTGLTALQKDLKKNAEMADVKKAVKTNTNELTKNIQVASQKLLVGHYEGGKFVKPTGATKRSVVAQISLNGLTGRTGPKTEYSPYLVNGTRFMAKRDFVGPPYRRQRDKFMSDMKRLVKG